MKTEKQIIRTTKEEKLKALNYCLDEAKNELKNKKQDQFHAYICNNYTFSIAMQKDLVDNREGVKVLIEDLEVGGVYSNMYLKVYSKARELKPNIDIMNEVYEYIEVKNKARILVLEELIKKLENE